MKINLIAPINDLGYGYTGLHILDELMKLGHKVALFPIGQPNCHPRHEASVREGLVNADEFSTEAPCIRLWHQHDMSMFVGKGKHIGFPIFELDTFSDKEKHHLTSCDRLFVCSKWAKGVIEENGITNQYQRNSNYHITQVVPLGVDNSIFTPKMSKRKPTIFLNVGKWEVRKGHDVLIDVFERAFTPSDNVELWMMCDNQFPQAQEQVRAFEERYRGSNLTVRLLPRVESDLQVADIMQQADCGVFPSRAEGWNLEALEMLACGKQVIATDYSAHTEFLTDANSWKVSMFGVEPAYDGVWFNGQGNWSKLDSVSLDALTKYMQIVHDRKQTGNLELNRKGIETAKAFSWYNTAHTIVSLLE